MNMRAMKVLAAALALMFAGMVRCSMMPLSGGGTETGNPGMLECARAVFAEVDSAEQWSVARYLPGGERQLDPNCLLSPKPVVPLGKRTAGTQDTLVIVRGSNYLIITVVGYDTVIVVDTLYNNATIVRNKPVYDTVYPVAQAQENGVVIIERIVPDTLQTIDTIVNQDTLVVPLRDTTYSPITDSTTIFQVYNYSILEQRIVFNSISDGFLLDSAMQIAYIPVEARFSIDNAIQHSVTNSTNPYNINTSTSASLSRTAHIQGVTVFEKYSNADDDGFLFTPDLSQYSGAQFDTYSRMVQPAQALFSGTYTSGSVQKTTLQALFDAGSDYRIASTLDNRILLLSRQKTVNYRIAERISYEYQARDSSRRTPLLTLERYPQDGAISSQTVWFNFLNGPDVLDHRQNRLSTVEKEIYYRSGNLWALKAQVEVSNPERAPAPLLNGRVTAKMSYNDRGDGEFRGVIDKASGMLYGVYTENGVGHQVTYYRSIDRLEWEEPTAPDTGK